jgi:hypothetical protein
VDRLRDRGRVDDDVAAVDEGERRACVGQVGLPVVLGLARIGAVPDLVTRLDEPGNERAADLA